MSSLLLILLNAVLTCHYASGTAVLKPFVEADPFANAVGIALASFITMTLMAPFSYVLERALLMPYELGYLRTFAIMIIIMAVVQIVAVAMRRSGRWIPVQHAFAILMTTNCTVLGVALLSTMRVDGFIHAVLFGGATGLAFGVIFLMFTTLQQRLRFANIPVIFRDAPAALITAGLMALAFMGFTGLIRD
jgi:electron transport complex protein RnfA